MHTRERNSVFSFIYKGFRAFFVCIPRCIQMHTREPECIHGPVHAAPRHREAPGSPAKRIGGSLDVLPSAEGGGTLTAKRWPSGRASASGLYAFRPGCMHPYASGDAYIFSFRFGLVPTFRGGLRTCMHCMHHSLIEDSRKGKKPLILMHTMHTRERNSVFSFIYKGFRAFSKPFLYASPDAYRCIHAYKTAGRTSQCCEP